MEHKQLHHSNLNECPCCQKGARTFIYSTDAQKLKRHLHSFHLAAEILLLDGCSLIVFLLTASQGDQQLCISVIGNEELDCHYGQSLLLDRALQTCELTLCQQKLALTARVMLSPASPPILCHMHVLDIQLIVVEIAICVHQ